jgi:hypothetical protein
MRKLVLNVLGAFTHIGTAFSLSITNDPSISKDQVQIALKDEPAI